MTRRMKKDLPKGLQQQQADRIYNLAAALYSDLGGSREDKMAVATVLVVMVIAHDYPKEQRDQAVLEHVRTLMTVPFDSFE